MPGVLCRRPITQNSSAPTNIANVASGGSTTPRPIDTADSAKRPLVAMRAISIAAAARAATIIEMTADAGSAVTPLAMISATPFHCSAAGNANWSDTMFSTERTPLASGCRNSRKNSGTHASAPAKMPITCPIACWRGLPPSM